MKVLYVLGKNKAPFTFIQPLFVDNSESNSKDGQFFDSIDLVGHISSFAALLKDSSFKHLLRYSSSDVAVRCVLHLPASHARSRAQLSLLGISGWLRSIIVTSKSVYLILSGLILRQFKVSIHFSLSQFSLPTYNLAFIAGTHDAYACTLFRNLDSVLPSKIPFVWLPHAAHHGSYINTLPTDLFQSSRIVDVWLPSAYETLEKTSSNILTFKSGYIPFSSQCLETQKNIIRSLAKPKDVILLLRQFMASANPSTYHVSEADIQSAIKNTRNLVSRQGHANVIVCLHPSVSKSYIRKMLKGLGLTDWQVTHDYFLDHAGPQTIVLGFYSTVLVHSLALGLETYAFYDPIFQFLRECYPLFFNIYWSSRLTFLSLDYSYEMSPLSTTEKGCLPKPPSNSRESSAFEDFLEFSRSSDVACLERLTFLSAKTLL